MVPVDELVFKLIALRDFIAVVLLTIWTSGLYDLTEVRLKGYTGARFDKAYHTPSSASRSGFAEVQTTLFRDMAGHQMLLLDKHQPRDLHAIRLRPVGRSLLEFYPTFRFVLSALVSQAGVGAAGNLVRLQGFLEAYENGARLVTLAHPVVAKFPVKVSRVGWWMGLYGGRCPKRQYAFSNSHHVRRLDLGVLKKTHRKRIKDKGKFSTVSRRARKDGTVAYTGTKDLKSTEIYPLPFADAVADIFQDLKCSGKGCPTAPQTVPGSGLQAFSSAETPADVQRLFRQADLESVYDYLRGGTHLEMPPEWRSQLPVRARKVSRKRNFN
ncbi:unnamed protein product [Symbiodinium sp. CCMP2456]|nr:unnamed protein product [Symbiodinium sp. CCMP2456]